MPDNSDEQPTDGTAHLALTKVGFVVALAPLIALVWHGELTGYAVVGALLTVYFGAALWGYGYGWLRGVHYAR